MLQTKGYSGISVPDGTNIVSLIKTFIIMDELLFEEIEAKVFNHSAAYLNSTAFREALSYVEQNDYTLYKGLINIEFHEAFE